MYSPSNNTISSVTKPTFCWSKENGISSNQIAIITNGVTTIITLASNVTNYYIPFDLPEGTNFWKARVKTSPGQWQIWSSTYNYIVDTTAPGSVSNPTPANNAILYSNNVTLSWSGTSDASGIDGYKVVINGITNYVTDTNITIKDLSEGSYTWGVAAVDNAGNVGNYMISHFTIKSEQTSCLAKNTFSVMPNLLFKDEIMEITYAAEPGAKVRFEIYTIVGSLIKIIAPKTLTRVYWDGTNDGGKEVASGIYLIIMRVDRKMVYHPVKVGYIGRHK